MSLLFCPSCNMQLSSDCTTAEVLLNYKVCEWCGTVVNLSDYIDAKQRLDLIEKVLEESDIPKNIDI